MAFETRLTPEMIARHTASGWWGTDTIYGLLSARVAMHPDREVQRLIEARDKAGAGSLSRSRGEA